MPAAWFLDKRPYFLEETLREGLLFSGRLLHADFLGAADLLPLPPIAQILPPPRYRSSSQDRAGLASREPCSGLRSLEPFSLSTHHVITGHCILLVGEETGGLCMFSLYVCGGGREAC